MLPNVQTGLLRPPPVSRPAYGRQAHILFAFAFASCVTSAKPSASKNGH